MAKNASGFGLADTLSNEGYAVGQVQETSMDLSAKEIIAHFSYPLLSEVLIRKSGHFISTYWVVIEKAYGKGRDSPETFQGNSI